MKIAITSDTHYGYDHRTHKIHEKFLGELSDSCAKHKVDLLVHAGDWIADNQHQLPRTWKMFRKFLGNIPILAVTGNHDLWDRDYWGSPLKKRSFCRHPSGMSLNQMASQHIEWSLESNIHLLQDNPFFKDDFIFYGFNGWYGNSNPPTNDSNYMSPFYESAPTSLYLSNQAYKQLDKIILESNTQNKDKKKVCVTHMPPYSKDARYEVFCANNSFLDPIAENFDLLIVGHSHQTEDWMYNSLRVVNPGTYFDPISGGYNKPKFVIIDL
jgi:predicted phosphodiesterase